MSNYDFRTLSPTDFEDLVRDLLQAEMNLLFESFGSGRDDGIDIRRAEAGGGKIIVQAKHYRDSGFRPLLSAMKKERHKIDQLQPSRYILATSVSLTPRNKSALATEIGPYLISEGDIFAANDLNNLLGRHTEVEKRHFKLWISSTSVLQRILHNATYVRSQDEAQRIEQAVRIFAQNPSVEKALSRLDEYNLLIISGAPGVGKTTLARIISWLHMQDNWELFAVESFDEALDNFDGSKRQIFFFDDFLGQIRLTPEVIRRADSKLIALIDRVQKSPETRFVLTTREHILSQARISSENLSLQLVELRKYIIDVSIYTRSIKAKILYNHIYFTKLSKAHNSALLADEFYLKIIDHPNFSPRIIEFITIGAIIAKTRPENYRDWVENSLANPERIWNHPFREHLTRAGRTLVSTMFFLPDQTEVPALQTAFTEVYRAEAREHGFSTDYDDFRRSMQETSNSFLQVANGRASIANPSLRDFLDNALIGTPYIRYTLGHLTQSRQASAVTRYLDAHFDRYNMAYSRWVHDFEAAAEKLSVLPETISREIEMGRVTSLEGLSLLSRIELLFEWWEKTRSKTIARAALQLSRRVTSEELWDAEVVKATELFALTQNERFEEFPERGEFVANLEERAFRTIFEEWAYPSINELVTMCNFLENHLGDLPDSAAEGLSVVIGRLVASVEDELSELTYSSEVAEFAANLEKLTNWSGDDQCQFEDQISERYVELEEQEAEREDDYEGYRPSSGARSSEESDNAIRSMFSTLS